MEERGFERLERTASRTLELLARPNPPTAIAAVMARPQVAAEAYVVTCKEVKAKRSSLSKESREAKGALAPLAKAYDVARGVLNMQAPDEQVGPAASKYATPDDLLNGAEALEDAFEAHQAEEWAAKTLEAYSPVLDAAAKEWTESVVAGAELQKALERRREAAAVFEATMVGFRRVVRTVYGSTSKEYHSIKVYRSRGVAEADPRDEAPVAPPAEDVTTPEPPA